MKELRQYGEMRTGTNYLSYLLKTNYNINIYHINKHEPFDGRLVECIISMKDPYAWMWSMLNCKLLTQKTLFRGILSENPQTDFKLQEKLVDRFNSFYKSLLKIPEELKEIVLFNNLISNPQIVVESIANKFNLISKQPFTDEKRYIRSEERIMSNTFNKKEFYLNEEYLSLMSRRTKDIVEYCIDWNIMEEFNLF